MALLGCCSIEEQKLIWKILANYPSTVRNVLINDYQATPGKRRGLATTLSDQGIKMFSAATFDAQQRRKPRCSCVSHKTLNDRTVMTISARARLKLLLTRSYDDARKNWD